MITLKNIADIAGVTVTTVSRALNNRGYVSMETRKKINQVMKDLNYQPNELARSLSLSKSSQIAVIVPSVSNMFFCKVVDKLEYYAAERGLRLLVCNSNHEVEKEIKYLNMLRANRVMGIVLASHTKNLAVNIHKDEQLPLVSIFRVLSSNIPHINPDNFEGGKLAAEHLISQGCTRLAHVSGSRYLTYMDANKRYDGFCSVCEAKGVPHILFDANEENFIRMDYSEIANLLYDKLPDVDGIFTSNDVIAAQIIRACHKRNLCVPKDIKVMGYDDIDLSAFYSPSITTIRQPIEDICKNAVELIVAQAEGRSYPIGMIFPVSLIKREST
jgi:LacI family sucrose operon transcriptional repressor